MVNRMIKLRYYLLAEEAMAKYIEIITQGLLCCPVCWFSRSAEPSQSGYSLSLSDKPILKFDAYSGLSMLVSTTKTACFENIFIAK